MQTTANIDSYGRVSTREQNLARQQAALTAAGCAKCFFDKASGKNTDWPELACAASPPRRRSR
ncbi:recombinase family protein [Micromonospora sp. NPDC049051]|uniref:recombinase family protein n=1 Tax=Micromonospora sp. NPDC049051 TaxID=3364264 RepID=UPI00371DE3BF